MPYLKINTNVSVNEEQCAEMLNRFSKLLASETAKPERYVVVELNAGKPMAFAGSTGPLAFLECKSIGLSTAQAKSLSASLSKLLTETWQIPGDRIYIEFANSPAEYWRWNGATFA